VTDYEVLRTSICQYNFGASPSHGNSIQKVSCEAVSHPASPLGAMHLTIQLRRAPPRLRIRSGGPISPQEPPDPGFLGTLHVMMARPCSANIWLGDGQSSLLDRRRLVRCPPLKLSEWLFADEPVRCVALKSSSNDEARRAKSFLSPDM